MGKGPRAVATVIDSQSVKATETVGRDSRGYDAGKKINGRKRHLVVDTRGLPLLVMVTPAFMTPLRPRKSSFACASCTPRSPSSGPTAPTRASS
ncbi:hypothetical protein BJ965_007612 [Streptomyces luteogriseus]|uniref:Transposase IS4-like domain-containing protein n=1 Tax=Streptomyces luteogriseus TaxID=68233 RepID=A0A7W7DVS9_9ACTN|nr:hypothetical protein [Streptomyces luteogriseus]